MKKIKFRSTRFIDDCRECDVDIGAWCKISRTLTASDSQIAELKSRAEFYADPDAVDAPRGLRSAAASVLRVLEASL